METSDQEQQQLAWSQEIPNYGNKLLKRLDDFRKTTLYDVCVHTQNGDFNAHKVILAACGGIFRTCFVDEERQMINDIREISFNCPAQGFKPILRFAYSGSLVVTKRNAVATMMAAGVINMKEVQEICAGIAVKEYGWVVNFTGEKSPAIIANLKKVLQIHSHCFNSTPAANGVAENEPQFPFIEDVQNEIPDHVITYRKLAEKLKNAEVVAASKDLSKKINTGKTNGANGTVTETPVPDPSPNAKSAKKRIEPANTHGVAEKPATEPLKQSEVIKKTSVEADDVTDSVTALHDEVNTPQKISEPSKSKPPPPSTNPNPTINDGDNKKPVEGQSGASVTVSVDDRPKTTQTADCVTPSRAEAKVDTTTKVVTTPTLPTPPTKTLRKDIPTPSPQSKSTTAVTRNGKSNGSLNAEDASPNLLKAPRRENIPAPSPKVKPRVSMRIKKAAPPPPAVGPAASNEKSTPEKPPAPRRSTKTTPKVPPPRPRPPVKQTTPSESEVSSKVSITDDYDDTLNPFS